MTSANASSPFRLAYVPGVIPTKWVRTWQERFPEIRLELLGAAADEAAHLVRSREVEAALLRLPIDRTGLHAIPLYTETTVVVVPKDHLMTAADEISVEDLSDDVVLHPLDDALGWEELPGQPAVERPNTTADAIELVAAGVGLLVVPQSLARLHHRKDLTYRPVSDAPESRVALSWLEEETTEAIEQFIGIVRGRTANSTRGQTTPAAKRALSEPTKRKPTTDKTKGKNQGRRSNSHQGKRGKPRR